VLECSLERESIAYTCSNAHSSASPSSSRESVVIARDVARSDGFARDDDGVTTTSMDIDITKGDGRATSEMPSLERATSSSNGLTMMKALRATCASAPSEDAREREVSDGAIALDVMFARTNTVASAYAFVTTREAFGETSASRDARALFARIRLRKTSASASERGEYRVTLDDSEVEIVSAKMKPNVIGRVVAIRDFVVVRDETGEARAVEALEVEHLGEYSRVVDALGPHEGVAEDARSLDGKVGVSLRGVVEAVSPMIYTAEAMFFQASLRADDGEKASAPVIFNGEHLARWRCMLKLCVGTRVEMRNLRKVILFKGDSEHELRAFAAAAEFCVELLQSNDAAPTMDLRCRCATCISGATLGSFKGSVTAVYADRGCAVLNDEVKLTFSHVPLGNSVVEVPGFRVGAKVVITHAHPVYRHDDVDFDRLQTLGADLRTQILVTVPAIENEVDGPTVMYAGGGKREATSKLSRAIKYAIEHTSFVYAEALTAWCEAFHRKFNFLTDSRIIDVATVEYALGLAAGNEQALAVAPILRLTHDSWDDVQIRGDVYEEFFRPRALGGVARDSFVMPLIDALKRAAFESWRDENYRSDAGTRGSTRDEGKPAIRAVASLGRESSQLIFAMLKCQYARTHLVDASGSVEVLVTSVDGDRTPSTSLLNKLVIIDVCEIVCEGPYFGLGARALDLESAPVRVHVVVDVKHLRALYPPAPIPDRAGTMFVAATLSKAGLEFIPPRLSTTAVTRHIDAPTWVFTLDESDARHRTTIQVINHDGGVKSLSGVMQNTTHAQGSKMSLTFRGESSWFSLMRFGTSYLVPIQSTSDLKASTLIVDERPGAEAYTLPREEVDEDISITSNASTVANVRNVRDILVWGNVLARRMVTMESWQPSPESVSFKGFVVSEQWHQNNAAVSQFGWEPQFKIQDIETQDVVDVYLKCSAFAVPVGFGVGALITIRQATRYVSGGSGLNIYVRCNIGVSTIEVHERSGATSVYVPKAVRQLTPRKTIHSMFIEATSSGDDEKVAIDRRTFEVRARVASVAMLQIRWCCPACACDAGSLMRVTLSNESGDLKRKLPAALAACEVCRPITRGGDRPGIFEVEASVTLDDGTAQAECWLHGQAAMALMPVKIRNEALSLVKKHGRVISRMTKASHEELEYGALDGGHVVRGHGSIVLCGKDAAIVRSAVAYATSIEEMIFECRKQYKLFASDTSRPRIVALSFPDVNERDIRCGEVRLNTKCLPLLRFWSANVSSINPREELMLALSQLK